MSTREILSLQFGNYSNYIGAHFWNIQELSFDYTGNEVSEVNHDILYREGISHDGQVTYTPRLLISDLKGCLNTLPESGGLDSPSGDLLDWENVETISSEPLPKNEFLTDIEKPDVKTDDKQYDFESTVNSWTDFLYPRFHPRSVNLIEEYVHNDEKNGFQAFPTGRKLWQESSYSENFMENVRRYLEECDSLQGFHITADATDGFGAVAVNCIEELTDQYPSKSILVYPVIASHFRDSETRSQKDVDKANLMDSKRLINLTMTMQSLAEYSSLFVPICTGLTGWRKPGSPRLFDHLQYDPKIYYHTSAILATALDTLSFKYRQRSNSFTMSNVCADMTGYGRKMAAATLSLPFTMNESDYLIDHLDKVDRPLLNSITPACNVEYDKIFQLVTVRGISEGRLKPPPSEASRQNSLPAYRCQSIEEMFQLYFQANCFLTATNITVGSKPLQIKTPFPRFFSKDLNNYGFVKNLSDERRLLSVPVMSGLHNGGFLSGTIENLVKETKRVKYPKFHDFRDQGLEEQEFKETICKLQEFKDNYSDNYEL